jgi:lactate permease
MREGVPMPLNLLTWVLALSPVLIVLILMMGFHWGGARAGAAAWLTALVVAAAFFGAGPRLIAYTQAKAVLLSLDVLYIIWTALLLYHISDEAGAIGRIGAALTRLTADRTLLALLVGWMFASFIQGMGGFGVPVAVAAPLLVGLGYSPLQSVLIACVGHGWAVNFGSLATSFQTLIAVTGLPGEVMAPAAALLLGLACFVCGALVAFISGGGKGLLRALPVILVAGALMAAGQYALATNRLWNLGATGGSLLGLAAGILLFRLPFYRAAPAPTGPPVTLRGVLMDFSAYGILVVLAFGANLVEPLGNLLDAVVLTLPFPELSTRLGWVNPAEMGRAISVFGHPGAILTYASLIAFFFYQRAGFYRPGAFRRILGKVARGAVPSSLAILALVGMSVIMSNSGMTNLLAEGLSRSFGPAVYPVVATLIGALGAFITGSNNNSNVLFGLLQMRTAELLGLKVTSVLGAQTAGGSLGSVMAPAKVIVGTSTVGLSGQEGRVIAAVIRYTLIPILFVAVVAALFLR